MLVNRVGDVTCADCRDGEWYTGRPTATCESIYCDRDLESPLGYPASDKAIHNSIIA